MRSSELAHLADTPADYDRFGLDTACISEWENGLRTSIGPETDGGRGNFEWWYVSSQFDGGEGSLVAVFHSKPTRAVDERIAPYVSVSIHRSGRDPIERRVRVDADDFSASTDDCDVRIGHNYLQRYGSYSRSHGGQYRLRIEDENLLVDMRLSSHMPPWRPDTGHFMFGDTNYFGWIVPVVGGNAYGTARVSGELIRLDGYGYHDHNFGNEDPARLMRRWQWYHGSVDNWSRDRHPNTPPLRPILNLSVLGAQLEARKEYGGSNIPIFVAANDGSIFVQGSNQLDSYLKTGDPTAHSAYFSYKDDKNRLGIHFDAEQEIAQRSRPAGTIAIRACDAAPLYRRFAGTMTVDHSIHDNVEGKYQNLRVASGLGQCTLEGMYFGEES